MTKALKGLALILLLFALVWAAVIGSWMATGANPTGTRMVVYLLALPVVLIVLVLAVRALWRNRKKRRDAAAQDTPANAQTTAQDSVANRRILLLGSALRLSIGQDPQEVLENLASGQSRPMLDETLVDDAGLPVFCARVADLDEAALAATLALPENDAEGAPLDWQPEQLRALGLLDQVLQELASDALAERLALEAGAPDASADTAGDDAEPQADDQAAAPPPLSAIRVFLALGDDWPQAQHDAGMAWLTARLNELRADDWPPVRMEAIATHGHPAALPRLDHWAAELTRLQQRELGIVLAAESMISEQQIQTLDRQDRLFRQANPSGLIPAEGAAGVIVTPATHPIADSDIETATAHRMMIGQRDAAQHGQARASGALLQRLADQALHVCAQTSEDISCIINDAGVDSAQGMETGTLTNGDFSHLDPVADCMSVGAACGSLRTAATVSCLALACARLDSAPDPVLVVSTQHPQDRVALIVAPCAADQTDDTASEAAAQNQTAA